MSVISKAPFEIGTAFVNYIDGLTTPGVSFPIRADSEAAPIRPFTNPREGAAGLSPEADPPGELVGGERESSRNRARDDR